MLALTRTSTSSDSERSASLPNDVALRFIPVIRRIAYRVARRLPAHVTVDDLISAGYLGLVDAYSKFDRARGDRFEVYAEYRIKGAILDELRSNDPLSRDLRSMANRIAEAVSALSTSLGRAPDEVELAAHLCLPIEVYRALSAKVVVGAALSLDAPVADAEDGGGMEIGDSSQEPVDVQFVNAESKDRLARAIDLLPARLQHVLGLYYREERTLREIGEELGVTESRVCQLHSEAIRRLRELCAEGEELPRGLGSRRRVRAA